MHLKAGVRGKTMITLLCAALKTRLDISSSLDLFHSALGWMLHPSSASPSCPTSEYFYCCFGESSVRQATDLSFALVIVYKESRPKNE